MTTNIIPQYIDFAELVMTKRGRRGINAKATTAAWWQRTPERQAALVQLHERTAFLPAAASLAERLYCIIHGVTSVPVCLCGQVIPFYTPSKGYRTACSRACSMKNPARTAKIVAHRDMNAIVQKARETNLQRYGVEWTTQLPAMVAKTRSTKQARYGDPHYSNAPARMATNLERYGVPHTCVAPPVIAKSLERRRERYPVLHDANGLRALNATMPPTDIAIRLGVTYRAVYEAFQRLNIPMQTHTKGRRLESRVAEHLQSLGVAVHQNIRTVIPPKELDFYFPDQRVAVEINGCYWHANDKQRHLVKHTLCAEAGIRLLQFWDYEWIEHPAICLSIVAQAVGRTARRVSARACHIESLTDTEYRQFVETHHLMGHAPASWRYGLYLHDELVAVMAIGKARFGRRGYELVRFACATGVHVRGGFSRLLRYWQTRHTDPLWSYTDRRLFLGSGYRAAGFRHVHTTAPGYFYFRKNERKSRYQCQRHLLASWLPEFDASLSERENMIRAGYARVYDCGQDVWVWKAERVE